MYIHLYACSLYATHTLVALLVGYPVLYIHSCRATVVELSDLRTFSCACKKFFHVSSPIQSIALLVQCSNIDGIEFADKSNDAILLQQPPPFYLPHPPTRSRGIKRNSLPCLRKILPAVCCGLMPTPSFVIIALVLGLTLNSSAQYLRTAVNGAASGTCVQKKKEKKRRTIWNGL